MTQFAKTPIAPVAEGRYIDTVLDGNHLSSPANVVGYTPSTYSGHQIYDGQYGGEVVFFFQGFNLPADATIIGITEVLKHSRNKTASPGGGSLGTGTRFIYSGNGVAGDYITWEENSDYRGWFRNPVSAAVESIYFSLSELSWGAGVDPTSPAFWNAGVTTRFWLDNYVANSPKIYYSEIRVHYTLPDGTPAWAAVADESVNDNGVWKQVLEGFVNDNGIWKQYRLGYEPSISANVGTSISVPANAEPGEYLCVMVLAEDADVATLPSGFTGIAYQSGTYSGASASARLGYIAWDGVTTSYSFTGHAAVMVNVPSNDHSGVTFINADGVSEGVANDASRITVALQIGDAADTSDVIPTPTGTYDVAVGDVGASSGGVSPAGALTLPGAGGSITLQPADGAAGWWGWKFTISE